MKEKIILWTFQTSGAWNQINQKGYLIGSKEFIDTTYLAGFEWMKSKMIEKIGSPEIESQFPLWAWYQHLDKFNKKPDLRRSGHLPKNTKGVRIKFLKNKNEVLLSDFELWHQPLYYKGYIGKNEADSLEFETRLRDSGIKNLKFEDYPSEIKDTIVNSWEKIFDLEFYDNYFTTHKDNKMIQACFWRLNLSDIISVDQFIGK